MPDLTTELARLSNTLNPELIEWIGFQLQEPWWHRSAACKGTDSDLFFIDRGHSAKAAKALCAECPVVGACLEWALGQSELPKGIWGGMGSKELRAERKRRRLAAQVA